MILDPASVPERQAYRLMISAFIPRPIAFVSTVSRDGVDNCAPFSYSMGVSSHPMVLGVSVGDREALPKDTARNILDTREFVVNLVTEEIAEKMNLASGDYAPEVSEFDEAGLTRATSEVVRAPRIAESPVNFECRLLRAVRVAGNTVFFGETLRLHVDDRVLTDGLVDIQKVRAIGRLGRRRLVSETRFHRRQDRRGLPMLGRAKPQELGIPEAGREGPVQLPRQPRVFRRREESARESGGVHLRQRVAKESGVGARGDEQGTVRLVGLAFGRERLKDRLDSVKLPFVQECGECLPVRFGTSRPVKGRNG